MAAAKLQPVKIQGRVGRHEQFINGTYEPTGNQHNGHPVWMSRGGPQPVYIYHTGKARWVVSKRLDDGAQCYAFLQDQGQDVLKAKGNWVCCDLDGEWRADERMHMTAALAPSDKFTKLRNSLGADLERLGLNNTDTLKPLWKRLDVKGTSLVPLVEVEKLVQEMVKAGEWPDWLNNRETLKKAYKKTTTRDCTGDDWVQKTEFAALLLNIFWFNKLWQLFSSIDGGDRKMDLGEFQRGLGQLGLAMSPQEAAEEFKLMDTDHGGEVLFVEFCGWIRNRVTPDHNRSFDASMYSGEHVGKVMRKSYGNKGTHAHFVKQKCFADFDELEKKIKAIIADNAQLKKLWTQIDFNGNNIVSLAEIDKLCVEAYPLLNHKPALMRAYKATIQAGDGDDWVQKHEFKMLLGNLFYFNKLFWMFEAVDSDQDRRLTYQEFHKLLTLTGAMARMSEAQAQSDFRRIDKNGGGIVLFDEFCQYFTSKECPEAMTSFVE